jgi:hypothetical protein
MLVVILGAVGFVLRGWALRTMNATNVVPAANAPEITLPILLIFGVVALLDVLALISVIFSMLDLDDRDEPLGLPRGTIRAVIALSLILIFIITALFVVARLQAGGGTVVIPGLTATQMVPFSSRIISATVISGTNVANPLYNVQLQNDLNAPTVDLAKQLMTLVGTLMVTVVGFYFGSRSASAPSAAGGAAAVRIDNVTPSKGSNAADQTEVSIQVTGANFAAGAVMQLRPPADKKVNTLTGHTTALTPTAMTATFNLATQSSGKWTVAVVNPDGAEGTNSFDVAAAPVKPQVSKVDPSEASNEASQPAVHLVITGTGFVANARVELRHPADAGAQRVLGTLVGAPTDTRIEANFDLAGKTAGTWTLAVINPDGAEGTHEFKLTTK